MARRRLFPSLLIGLLCVPVVLLAQDVVVKTDGGRLRGKILSETSRGVKIKTPGGVYTVPRNQILKVEREGDVFRELKERKKKLRDTDATGWFELGVWCQDVGLYPQAVDCFNQVIATEYGHEDARWELGYRRLNGRWVTEETYYRSKGYVRWEDQWVTQGEYDKLDAGLIRVDGEWVSRADAEARPKRRKTRKRSARKTKRPAPKASARKPAARQGFPWVGRNRPLGGQVGLPPLTEEQRQAQLDRGKARGRWKFAHASKYYDFYSNGPEKKVRKLARTMDLMCDEFRKIFKFEPEITRPFPIHLYGSQQEFMSRTGKGQGVGGYYDGRKIVGFHGKLGNLSTRSVLFHEGTHQFQGLVLGRNMWRASIWLIEGLAVFFEAAKVSGNRVRTGAIPKGRLAHVKRAIQNGSYVKLHDLIRLDQRRFGALHYAHAWSLIYFLVNGAKGGKKRFIQYWEKTKEGGHDPVKLFEELFNKPMDQIEAAWKAYVLKL